MPKKTYAFPKTGGKTINKTLAPATNKRWADFLNFFGVTKVSELMSVEGGRDFSVRILDIAADRNQLSKLMDTCLVEGSADVDFGDEFDLGLSDEVAQDFFGQRSRKFVERAKL